MKLAINGFGRIGRAAFKIAMENPDIEIVAINDLTDAKTLAHLLKYDTSYGLYSRDIKAEGSSLIFEGKNIPVLAAKDPATLPWKNLDVDVVLECTGKFVGSEEAGLHIKAGAKKVVISAPSKGENPAPTYVLGVNDHEYKGENVINNASCTTNCIAPVMKVLVEKFGVKKALLDTIHAYTHDQNIQDGPHKDLRRARAAAANMVPTSTGAAIAATEAIPSLKGKFDGTSIRVPVPVGSISDITIVLEKAATVDEINDALITASKSDKLKGILTTTNEPIVSADIVGNPASSIVDLKMTQVVGGDLAKVFAWYDNEWGYSNRLVEMAIKVVSYKPAMKEEVKPEEPKREEPKHEETKHEELKIEKPMIAEESSPIKSKLEETKQAPLAAKITVEPKDEEPDLNMELKAPEPKLSFERQFSSEPDHQGEKIVHEAHISEPKPLNLNQSAEPKPFHIEHPVEPSHPTPKPAEETPTPALNPKINDTLNINPAPKVTPPIKDLDDDTK